MLWTSSSGSPTRSPAGAIAVKGNHDEAIERRVGYFNDAATAALDWARATLGAAQRTFLAQLPLCVRDAPLCLVHASAANPQRYDYVDSPTAAHRCAVAAAQPFTFVGHVHDQALYYEGTSGRMLPFRPVAGTAIPVGPHRRGVAIVGSVGQPRDRNPAAAYALFDTAQSELTFFRVPYDHHAAAERIRQAGLPEALAYRVEMGSDVAAGCERSADRRLSASTRRCTRAATASCIASARWPAIRALPSS
jgi:diadenosine tetraphosphatase ApaH/serine/threonine PP2A family protein phosphatase